MKNPNTPQHLSIGEPELKLLQAIRRLILSARSFLRRYTQKTPALGTPEQALLRNTQSLLNSAAKFIEDYITHKRRELDNKKEHPYRRS